MSKLTYLRDIDESSRGLEVVRWSTYLWDICESGCILDSVRWLTYLWDICESGCILDSVRWLTYLWDIGESGDGGADIGWVESAFAITGFIGIRILSVNTTVGLDVPGNMCHSFQKFQKTGIG